MDTWFALIGGLGIGSVINSLVTSYMAKKIKINERLYEEKKTVYEGLLNAIHEAAVSPSDRNSMEYALWQTKCSLFGSREVKKYAQEIVDTNDGPKGKRHRAFDNLVNAMRDDLLKS